MAPFAAGFTGAVWTGESGADSSGLFNIVIYRLHPAKAGYTREDLRLKIEAANIETLPLWKPIHLQPIFNEYPFYGDGTSETFFNNGLCLPSHPALTNQDLERIVSNF